MREQNVEVLGQLFSTRVPRTGGAEGLAKLQVLDDILQRIKHLLKNEPTRMSDRLVKSLEGAEPLLPRNTEDTSGLHHAFHEVKNFGKSPEEKLQRSRHPTDTH